jgi:hypothetical protein
MHMCLDPEAPFKNAFDALGYDFEIIGNKNHSDNYLFKNNKNYTYFKKHIIESIRDKKRPVLGMGVASRIPEFCIITGYDESADIVTGWSAFQEQPKYRDKNIEIDKGGYFRLKNWFPNTRGIILIGDKHEKPPIRETYKKAIQWAVELFNSNDIVYGKKCGISAYQALTDTLLNDEYYLSGNIKEINDRYFIIRTVTETFHEGRGYAYLFFKQLAGLFSEHKKDFKNIASCYKGIIRMINQIIKKLYYNKNDEQVLKTFMKKKFRRNMVNKIHQIRDLESEAITIINKILLHF